MNMIIFPKVSLLFYANILQRVIFPHSSKVLHVRIVKYRVRGLYSDISVNLESPNLTVYSLPYQAIPEHLPPWGSSLTLPHSY